MINLKTKFKHIIVGLIFLNCILFSGCITDNEQDEVEKNVELYIGMTRNSTGYFPWMFVRDTPTLTININIFNSLIKLDRHHLGFKSGLAENWNNPDNLTWRFFLRKNVKFHNGYNFTAEDVKFTFEFLKNFSYTAEELQPISEIEILDDYTIDIRTEYPYPNLLNRFLTVYIISKQYIMELENINETWPVGTEIWPIGTGAYKLVEDIPDKHIILERFEDYWGDKPDIKKVIFKKMNTTEELINALKTGDLDIINIPFENVEEISDSEGLKVTSVQPPSVVYLSFDFRNNDSYGFPGMKNPTSDVRVRKAMYHAINISYLIKKYLNNYAEPATQFITKDILGFNPEIERLPYDLEIAKKYMIDAGYEEGFNITLDAPLSSRAINITNLIVEQLSEININVTPRVLSSTEYYLNLYIKDTSFYITSFNHFDSESSLKLLLQTPNIEENEGIWNYGNYSNSKVDEIIINLSYTMEPDLRKELLQEAFFSANEDVAWIPLYSTKVFYGIREDLIWNPRPSLFIWVEEIFLN
jgi:peptide/nickel transport system substrate-binding protein